MIKGMLHQEDITLLKIYAPNQGALKYIKKLLTEIKGELDKNTIIVGDLNTPLTALDRLLKQKINKEILAFHDTINKMDIMDIYRPFHPRTSDYTLLSSAHGIFSRIDHMLHHKTGLNKFKKTEITSSIFSDHSALKF